MAYKKGADSNTWERDSAAMRRYTHKIRQKTRNPWNKTKSHLNIYTYKEIYTHKYEKIRRYTHKYEQKNKKYTRLNVEILNLNPTTRMRRNPIE